MLRDSAHIQEMEAEWKNRKARRAGRKEVEPLYTVNDANQVLKYFYPVHYGETVTLSDSLTVRFTDVGHLLGSASIEVWLTEGEVQKKLAFSGDIGNKRKPIIRDPQYLDTADYVVMECTYGDRLHQNKDHDHEAELAGIIQETLDGRKCGYSGFAVGRTQELLYFIRHIKQHGLVKGHGDFPVYVDSPLAVEATHVFNQNLMDCYDEETRSWCARESTPSPSRG